MKGANEVLVDAASQVLQGATGQPERVKGLFENYT